MADITGRLRAWVSGDCQCHRCSGCRDGADAIERLRAALETIVEKDQWFHEGARCDGEFAKIARASLHIQQPIGRE